MKNYFYVRFMDETVHDAISSHWSPYESVDEAIKDTNENFDEGIEFEVYSGHSFVGKYKTHKEVMLPIGKL